MASQQTSAQTLLILGDSLSAGYRLSIDQAWVSLMTPSLIENSVVTNVVNASISGDTTGNGLNRLPMLLKEFKPEWVLIELGANDGLQGINTIHIRKNLEKMITLIRENNIKVMLMEIQIPPNYGSRYTTAFANIYPSISKEMQVDTLPFFMIDVISKPDWIFPDGIHPNEKAQPWIAKFMESEIKKHIQLVEN